MAEFPGVGAHCNECGQLDLLPIKCDACSRILCKDHHKYASHGCTEAYKKDTLVPICPLCQRPVPIKRGENRDVRVNEHIEFECSSDLAKKKIKTALKCGVKGCLKKELVIMDCNRCGVHFCLGHRHTTDHDCKGSQKGKCAISNGLDTNQMSQEQLNFLLAQQLQQEEYEQAYANHQMEAQNNRNLETRNNSNNNNCTIS